MRWKSTPESRSRFSSFLPLRLQQYSQFHFLHRRGTYRATSPDHSIRPNAAPPQFGAVELFCTKSSEVGARKVPPSPLSVAGGPASLASFEEGDKRVGLRFSSNPGRNSISHSCW